MTDDDMARALADLLCSEEVPPELAAMAREGNEVARALEAALLAPPVDLPGLAEMAKEDA